MIFEGQKCGSLIFHLFVKDAGDGDEAFQLFHDGADVQAGGGDDHVNVGEFFSFIDRGNVKRTNVYLEFSQSGSDSGEDADFVGNSKCDPVVSHLFYIYEIYLSRDLRHGEPDRRARYLVEP